MSRSVVIIGGGPAGSAAAIGLARAGWRVTVVEREAFPRIKVCGEFISPAATGVLEALIGADRLAALGARRVDEFVIECGEREARWRMPRPAWVLSRAGLDTALLGCAREAGAAVEQPARLRAVRYRGDGAEVEAEAPRGGARVLHADVVIHADGHGRFDEPGPDGRVRATPMRKGAVGCKCHVRTGPERPEIRMRACRGAYIGSVGVEGGLTTVALTARKELLGAHRGDADSMVRALWPRFEPAERASEWMFCGIAGSGYLAPGHARSFRVGNAAGAVEPVGGEGIGLALWSGWRLAELIERVDAGDPGAFIAVQRAFAREYRARLRWRRAACLAAAWALERPGLVRAVWPVIAAPGLKSAVIAPWYAMTGKSLRRELA